MIFFARYEASQCGSPYIELEQMLLGLMREARPLFDSLLSTQGSAKLEAEIRSAVAEPMQKVSTSVDLPLSSAAKQMLAYAVEEAERFNHDYIDTVHLLHGLMRVPSSTADVLRNYGLKIEDLRSKLAQPAVASIVSPAEALAELRREFMPALPRLTPEIEPAVVFRLQSGVKESAS